MKQLITILALAFGLLTFAQQAAGSKELVSKTETKAKQQQAADLKVKCPHYPSVVSSSGVNKQSTLTFDNWKKDYPAEYSAYLKIFDYAK